MVGGQAAQAKGRVVGRERTVAEEGAGEELSRGTSRREPARRAGVAPKDGKGQFSKQKTQRKPGHGRASGLPGREATQSREHLPRLLHP